MPYLLRNLLIDRPNQVWCTDISYVAMEHGFMYLYAIIDVYSRYIVGWGLYNSLDASNAIEVLDAGVRRHGAPEIINSDQGCLYTSKECTRSMKDTESRSVWMAKRAVLIIFGLSVSGGR